MLDISALEPQTGVFVGPFDPPAAALPAFLPMSAFLSASSSSTHRHSVCGVSTTPTSSTPAPADGMVPYPAGPEVLAEWVKRRAAEIDRLTGLAVNAAALVRVCSEPPLAVPGLEELAEATAELVYAVYGKPQAQAQELTLEEYLAPGRRGAAVRAHAEHDAGDHRGRPEEGREAPPRQLQRVAAAEGLRPRAAQHSLLERYFVRVVDEAPGSVAAIVAYRFRAQDRDLFPLVEYALASVVPCIKACTLHNAWAALLNIFAGRPSD